VELFLGQEAIDPNPPDNGGNTPLSWAAINGHELVVKQPLDRDDVNSDRPNNWGNTPLSWAQNNGHTAVVTGKTSTPTRQKTIAIHPFHGLRFRVTS